MKQIDLFQEEVGNAALGHEKDAGQLGSKLFFGIRKVAETIFFVQGFAVMVRSLKLCDIEVVWEEPASNRWQSAAWFDRVNGLVLERFTGRAAKPGPAVVLDRVRDAAVRDCRASVKSLNVSRPGPQKGR